MTPGDIINIVNIIIDKINITNRIPVTIIYDYDEEESVEDVNDIYTDLEEANINGGSQSV